MRAPKILLPAPECRFAAPHLKTAMGLSYYAGMEESQREALLERMLQCEPEHAERILRLTNHALDDYARDGFAVSCGDWYSVSMRSGFRSA